MRLYIYGLLPALLYTATACQRGTGDSTLLRQRQQVEDSIGAGHTRYAMEQTRRHMVCATDSDTYYLWLSTRNKAYYTAMDIDSMTATTQRIGGYLDRHAQRHGSLIDRLRTEWYTARGVYQSVVMCRPDSAQRYNDQAIALIERTGRDPGQMLTALTNRGDYYRQTGQLDLSADAYLQALALADSMQSDTNARIIVMLGISTVYTFMADYANSDRWWHRTGQLLPQMNKGDQFIYYNNRGNDYYLQDRYRQALPYFTRAARLVQGDPKRQWDYYTVQANLAEVYACLGQTRQAHQALCQADSFFRRTGFDIGLYYTETTRMRLALADGHRSQALNMALRDDKPRYMIPAAQVLRLKTREYVLRQLGRPAQAYTAHRQMHVINDSLQTANIQMRMNANMLQYRHDKQLAEQQHVIDHQRLMGLLAWGLFILAVLVIAILAVLILLHRRRRQVREMQARQQIVKLRMENTRNRISPHFIYNALNHEMVAQMQGHEVHLDALTQLLRRGVERAHALQTTLQEEIEFVDYYVSIERQQMPAHFDYRTHIAPDVRPQQVMLPAMVIQIFAENAIKHGLRPMTPADGPQRLDIRISRQGGKATLIEVIDNGVGMRSSHIQENTGMRVVRQTIQILNDHNRDRIDFGVANYTDPDTGQTGCRSWISVPDDYNYNL